MMILNYQFHHSGPLVKVEQGEIKILGEVYFTKFSLTICFKDIVEAKFEDFMPYLILNLLNYLTTWEGWGALPLLLLSLLPHQEESWEVGSQDWVHHTPH